MAKIEDVKAAAVKLGETLQAFDAADQQAKASRLAANAQDARATSDEHDAGAAKQAVLDAHQAFDAVLDEFFPASPPPASVAAA